MLMWRIASQEIHLPGAVKFWKWVPQTIRETSVVMILVRRGCKNITPMHTFWSQG